MFIDVQSEGCHERIFRVGPESTFCPSGCIADAGVFGSIGPQSFYDAVKKVVVSYEIVFLLIQKGYMFKRTGSLFRQIGYI